MSRNLRPRGTIAAGPSVAFGRALPAIGDKRFAGTQNSGITVPKKKRTAFGDRTNEMTDVKADSTQPFKKTFKPSASTNKLPPPGIRAAAGRPLTRAKVSHRSHNVLPSVHKKQPTPANKTTTTINPNTSVSDQISLDVISLSSNSTGSANTTTSDEFRYSTRVDSDDNLVISTGSSTNSSHDNGRVPTSKYVSSTSSANSAASHDFEMIDSAEVEMKDCTVQMKTTEQEAAQQKLIEKYHEVDEENKGDQIHVADYAYDIFEYYKERESKFKVSDYLPTQKHIKEFMRSVLVDWLVEVQENFELNHETLYMAVKIIDLYLSKKTATKDKLQLIGATAMFIASKFDERMPPLIEDFTFICDDAYTAHMFIVCEMEILKTIDFDLGFPLSYRFLRRWSKVSRDAIEMLTLARYILESSLMTYQFALESESKIAAASLYLAHCMKKQQSSAASSSSTPTSSLSSHFWSPVLEYHSGFTASDLQPLSVRLNKMLRQNLARKQDNLQTVFSKYSHEVFHKVAQIPLVSDDSIPASTS